MENQPRILIVDDDSMIRLLIAKTMQSIGMSTSEAASGEDGLKRFQQEGADIIMLDVMFPDGIDGYQTCHQFRAMPEAQHIPILMMTGLEDLDSITRSFEAGATDFITKPVNITLLTHRIRYMLRASNTTKRLMDSERRLHRMAYFDKLTDLPNRQFFHEHLQNMIALAHRQKLILAVLFLDLDGFKRINDTLGHHIGDDILQLTGERLSKTLRSSDTTIRIEMTPEVDSLARLGGDEFTVLLSTIAHTGDAAIVAERIRQCLSEPYILDNHELYTTTSIGIAVFPNDGDNADELIKNADMAMYYAKRAGGNTFQFFSSEMTEIANRRLNLENYLRKAIERGEFSLYYQPQIDLNTSRCFGIEVLLRWHNPELGLVSPTEFIPLAEETGLIVSIGEWMLQNACTQAVIWQNQGITFDRLAINVSAIQLLHRGYLQSVKTILSDSGLKPSLLEIELTESTLISDENVTLGILQSLREIGVNLAVDDFGTGYSSLSRLRSYPIDCLKIDQDFIRHVDRNPDNAAIVSAVIAMAKGMDMNVIAEGIETNEQITFLIENGCTKGQGYLLSKPLTLAEANEFLLSNFQANK